MEPVSVFIGLVSHPKSSFSGSQGPEGLTSQLALALGGVGVRTQVQVNTANLFDESEFPLTAKMARESVRQEIRLEGEWFHFLKKPQGLSHLVRMAGRLVRYFIDWRDNSKSTELRRLLNIEYSHVDLYRAAVASGLDWAVILEDDAYCPDPAGFARGIVELMNSTGTPKYVNLTTSFSLTEIGIEHLLSTVPHVVWAGPGDCSVIRSERPATNTVCAIAFSREFLEQVLADFDSHPAEPIVPIDWKLNATLMRLWELGSIKAGECWFLEPGPVVQLSMVKDRIDK
jgi:hypothetical protein